MATKKISTRVLDALKLGEYVFDKEIRGFGARRLPSKRVQFFYRYRDQASGQRVRMAIGLWGDGMTADDARDVALGYATDVRKNKLSPREEAKAKEQAAIDKRDRASLTVSAVCEDYFAGPGAKLRTIDDLKSMYETHIKDELGHVSLFDLKRSQVSAMLDKAEKRAAATLKKRKIENHDSPGAVAADRVLALLRRALNWQQSRSDNFVSPIVKGMARTKPKERARERTLAPAEIKAVWEASKAVEPAAFGHLVRCLFLTAARRDELAAGQWGEVREDQERGAVFEIGAERVKTKKEHVIPLTAAVVTELPKKHEGEGRPYIFGRNGTRAFSGYSKSKRKLDAAILTWMQGEAQKRGENRKKVEPLPHWTLHDIRRTCRSILSGEGVSNDVAERCLGHVMQGVRGVYDRYSYLPEKRAALEKLAMRLVIIVSDEAKKVFTLKRA